MHPASQLVGISADALSVIQHTTDPNFSITHVARSAIFTPVKCRNCLDSPDIAVLLHGRFPRNFQEHIKWNGVVQKGGSLE